jgi:hypothetical protein
MATLGDGMLSECQCGEPLVDSLRKCPNCGTSNAEYRYSRWRVFWPDVDSLVGAQEAVRLGYWAAFVAAGLGAIAAVVGAIGAGLGALGGLVDAGVYALCGLGIWHKWRSAAVVGFLLFVANLVLSVKLRGGVGVLALFIFVGFLNGLRGTFAHATLRRHLPPEGAG